MVHSRSVRDPVSELFRQAMARVCTPVAVVTTFDDGPHGTTVSAFASLSLHPPMVMVSLDRTSELLRRLSGTGRFGVNVLSSAQSDLASRLARKGSDSFAGFPWHEESGCPRFEGAVAWLGCRVANLVEGGDHRVVLADVLSVRVADAEPLTYHARAFGTHAPIEVRQL